MVPMDEHAIGQKRQLKALKKSKKHAHLFEKDKDSYIVLSNSDKWSPEIGRGHLTCVRPNSEIFSTRLGGFITGVECMASQGISETDHEAAQSHY